MTTSAENALPTPDELEGEIGLTSEEGAVLESVVERCEAGVSSFVNDDMSRVLVLVEKLRARWAAAHRAACAFAEQAVELRALTPDGHRARLTLAASRGVLSALASEESLWAAAKCYRIEPSTLEGDAFETAFEWARDLRAHGKKACGIPVVVKAIQAARAKALEDAAALFLRTRCREWSVAECALAVRTLDHPPDCSCHRWVDCGRPA